MGEIKLRIQNLTKIFNPKGRTVTAVNNVNLDIKKGEFVCLLGPSGCGKITTLRMIAGFELPTQGSILLNNKDIAYLTPDKRGISMVFQNYALFPHMSVYENIAYGLKIQKRSKEEIKQRVDKILETMKMEDFADRKPSQLSGGQQQRVSLARALVMKSDVLLFDEPLSNLDAKLRLHMRDEIRKLQQESQITSIYVTHDQAEAMALSDKIVIMKDGNIIQVGTPQEIYQKPNSEFVAKFIGRANILDATVLDKNKIKLLNKEYTISETIEKPIGEPIKVVIRPEAIDFNGDKHSLIVAKSVFMGENQEYEVLDDDKKIIELSLNNPHGKEIKSKGQILTFSFNADTIHVL